MRHQKTNFLFKKREIFLNLHSLGRNLGVLSLSKLPGDPMARFFLNILQVAFIVLILAPLGSIEAQDVTRQGGDLTSDFPGRFALQLPSPNIASTERFNIHLSGFSVFHQMLTAEEGLGPEFNHVSCGGCHVENGRGAVHIPGSHGIGSPMIVKVAFPGLELDGSPKDLPGVGGQIRDRTIAGTTQYDVKVRWIKRSGRYPDGTSYQLRRPDLNFKIPGLSKRKLAYSLRMSPALIGLGLLENVPVETIIGLSDPYDANGDGISGKPQYVKDPRTKEIVLGRFGYKASNPTVEAQSAGAAFNDMGFTSSIFNNTESSPEMTDDELFRMVLYLKVGGVPAAKRQTEPKVVEGKKLFKVAGCDSCHTMTLRTGPVIEDPELANQEFHPFTDLLLHDMGRELGDKRAEFSALGRDWRTTPLWGLGFSEDLSTVKARFLHDGRARTVEEAILWHGGEGAASRDKFKNFSGAERDALVTFLRSL